MFSDSVFVMYFSTIPVPLVGQNTETLGLGVDRVTPLVSAAFTLAQ